jgi:hypothetical protein
MIHFLGFPKSLKLLNLHLSIRLAVFLLFAMVLASPNLYAQEVDAFPIKKKRTFVGGNLGIQFGTVTILDISPYVGYRMTKGLSIGAGFTYQYFKDGRGDEKYSSNIYGGRLFTSYTIIPEIFAYAEYEVLNFEVPNSFGDAARKNVSSVLVGGGYRQMIGPNMFSDIMILWNLTESVDSPYTNPIYRVGISIGL